MPILLLFLLLISGCQGDPQKSSTQPYTTICGRDGVPAYRMRVPSDWKRAEATGPLEDTKHPLCEFWIEGAIRLTIHNFPGTPIPPEAQLARWQRQFEKVEDLSIRPWSYGGFTGLVLEAEGLLKGSPSMVLGWAMRLAPEHLRHLENPQLRADYTIKVVGPLDRLSLRKKEIIRSVQTFELIAEIPGDL